MTITRKSKVCYYTLACMISASSRLQIKSVTYEFKSFSSRKMSLECLDYQPMMSAPGGKIVRSNTSSERVEVYGNILLEY